MKQTPRSSWPLYLTVCSTTVLQCVAVCRSVFQCVAIAVCCTYVDLRQLCPPHLARNCNFGGATLLIGSKTAPPNISEINLKLFTQNSSSPKISPPLLHDFDLCLPAKTLPFQTQCFSTWRWKLFESKWLIWKWMGSQKRIFWRTLFHFVQRLKHSNFLPRRVPPFW